MLIKELCFKSMNVLASCHSFISQGKKLESNKGLTNLAKRYVDMSQLVLTCDRTKLSYEEIEFMDVFDNITDELLRILETGNFNEKAIKKLKGFSIIQGW